MASPRCAETPRSTPQRAGGRPRITNTEARRNTEATSWLRVGGWDAPVVFSALDPMAPRSVQSASGFTRPLGSSLSAQRMERGGCPERGGNHSASHRPLGIRAGRQGTLTYKIGPSCRMPRSVAWHLRVAPGLRVQHPSAREDARDRRTQRLGGTQRQPRGFASDVGMGRLSSPPLIQSSREAIVLVSGFRRPLGLSFARTRRDGGAESVPMSSWTG